MSARKDLIASIPGPVAVTGATGFIGANLVGALRKERNDVIPIGKTQNTWREQAINLGKIEICSNNRDVVKVLEKYKPKTLINLAAYGAYPVQTNVEMMLKTNFELARDLAQWSITNNCALVQAGSSSEYGWNAAGPSADSVLRPNSMYAVTKASASQWVHHLARSGVLAATTLRLYSVYGPLEDPNRLFPTIIRQGLRGQFPPFAAEKISRDFVFIDDVIDAFLITSSLVRAGANGYEIPICTGISTSMNELSSTVSSEFGIEDSPEFGAIRRNWDLADWFGNPELAQRILGWQSDISVAEGLRMTRNWYEFCNNVEFLNQDLTANDDKSVRSTAGNDRSGSGSSTPDVSAVVACYKDAEAMPVLYERFKKTMDLLELSFELIFVNDGSPDNAQVVAELLSAEDARVIAINHSRNFGSQAAFLSGMKMASGNYVVLMDGDLQDPPELIAQMWQKSQDGFDVVYGHRVDREAPWLMNHAYKIFYKVFNKLSPFEIPKNAGDFSLLKRNVVDVLISMPERDLFLRASRAYVGFNQTGVDYVRPERPFGKTTNNLSKNLGWAARGILAVSRAPLTGLSIFAIGMLALSSLLIALQIFARLFFPELAPKGLTSLSIIIVGLGALNLVAIAIVGEYVGRILEETKNRPRFVIKGQTRNGVTEYVTSRDGE